MEKMIASVYVKEIVRFFIIDSSPTVIYLSLSRNPISVQWYEVLRPLICVSGSDVSETSSVDG